MGRVRSPIPRSRLPLHRRVLADPAAVRRWLVVVALAAATAGLTARALAAGEAARTRWGTTRVVLVATRAVRPGEALTRVVRPVRWPLAHVPSRALTHLPAGSRARAALDAGAPVTAAVVTTSMPGAAPGRRRLAVPVGPARLPLRAGDRVDVWATVDPSLARGRLTTSRVAVAGVVTSAGPHEVVVAVEPGEVADVAEALARATVTLVATR